MFKDEWNEVKEGVETFWVNEQKGTVLQTSDGRFIAIVPKAIKVGPFTDLSSAKSACENTSALEAALEQFNENLLKDLNKKL